MAFPAPSSVEDRVIMRTFNDVGRDQYNIGPTIFTPITQMRINATAIFVSNSMSGPLIVSDLNQLLDPMELAG